MKNYQRVNYEKYYVTDEEGNHTQVTRDVCFAVAEPPTKENPLKQRWFYDEEARYVVRLARTQANEDMHRINSTSLKQGERYRNRKFSCIYKGTNKCDKDCNSCTFKNTSRTVELDKNWTNDGDEMESSFIPIDESQDIFNILEEKEFMSILLVAYESLSIEEQELFNFLINKEKKKVIADKLKITVDGVRYRELQLRKKLLSNKDLKDYLNK